MSGLSNYQKYIMESAFKNAVKNKTNTNVNLSWYEEFDDISKRINISSIWIDSDYIPFNAPETDSNNIFTAHIGNVDIDVLERREDIILEKVIGTRATFSNKALVDAIDPAYGSGYDVKIVDDDGRTIPFGLNKWVVDSESGTLTFIDGFPEGYTQPIHISFFKYIGRKGNNGILTSDGSGSMIDGYEPVDEQNIATKKYVDSNISEVDKIVNKLVPDLPDTFEGKDLIILNPYYMANLAYTTDPEVPVVMRSDETLSLRVPTFYNFENKGSVSLLIGNNEVYKQNISDMVAGEGDIFYIDSIVDPYKDNIISDDFYKSINMTINLDISLHLLKYYNSSSYPIASYQLKYTPYNGSPIYSNKMHIGLDYQVMSDIKDDYFSDYSTPFKYFSGVPALVAGDTFKYHFKLNPINKFKKDVMGHITIKGMLDKDVITKSYYEYNDSGIALNETVDVTVPDGIYSESLDTHIEAYNIVGDSFEKNFSYSVRVDTLSSEAGRVTSPLNPEMDSSAWKGYGYDWDSKRSIYRTPELQMLAGKYQWPRGNYARNWDIGGDSEGREKPEGPNYNAPTDINLRYATFKFNIPLSNGVYITLNQPEGFITDVDDKTILNIVDFKCKVSGETDWLDINKPYDGVLNPNDTESKACLVVNKSDDTTKYVTFGDKPISGVFYVTIGIPKNFDIKFSGISVRSNI